MQIENFFSRILFLIAATVFGVAAAGILILMLDTENMKIAQLLQTVLVFALPAVLCAKFFSKEPLKFLHVQKTSEKNSFFALLFAFSAIPAINFFVSINSKMRLPRFLHSLELQMRATEEQLAKITEQMLSVDTIGGLAVNLVVIALLAAVCEELFFRGILQKTLSEMVGKHTAVWITALIFSAIHLQFYGFLPRMLLGAAFGYMLTFSGSIWLPMLAHFANNAVSVILFFIVKKQNIITENFVSASENFWYAELIFIPISIFFLLKINKSVSR